MSQVPGVFFADFTSRSSGHTVQPDFLIGEKIVGRLTGNSRSVGGSLSIGGNTAPLVPVSGSEADCPCTESEPRDFRAPRSLYQSHKTCLFCSSGSSRLPSCPADSGRYRPTAGTGRPRLTTDMTKSPVTKSLSLNAHQHEL